MAASRTERAFKSAIRRLVQGVTQDIIRGRVVRCSKCREFVPATLASVCTCSVCIYTAGRCHQCGGEDGATRSVIAHARSLSIKKSRKLYGSDHFDAVAQFSKSSRAKSTAGLRVLQGGRR